MNQRLGPVALILLQQAWKLRLHLSGFQDIEDDNGILRGWREGPLSHGKGVLGPSDNANFDTTRSEYYRRLGLESYRRPPPRKHRKMTVSGWGQVTSMARSKATDRKILRLLSDGTPIRSVMHQLHVGQGRVYRLLAKIQQRIARETRYGKATS